MATPQYRDMSSESESSTRDDEEMFKVDYLNETALFLDEHRPNVQRPSSKRTWWFIHCTLIIIYSVLFVLAALAGFIFQRPSGTLEMSPARGAVEFQEQYFDTYRQDEAVYFDEPSEEIDSNWNRLIANTNIRLHDEEFEPLQPREGIKLPDGGYMATLNAYHQLHCLKRVYRYMFPEYYFADRTEDEHRLNKLHNFHCLDALRQSVMCQGDTSVITMKWPKHSRIPQANRTYPHQCVNWNKLDAWAASRRIDPFAKDYLIHPTLGPAYPLGYNPGIGVTEVD